MKIIHLAKTLWLDTLDKEIPDDHWDITITKNNDTFYMDAYRLNIQL